jgi:hypothetical protein
VNAVAIMYVNEHLESLRADAHQHRSASQAGKRSLSDRIASAVTELRRTLGLESTGPAFPTLRDYPFEG